MGVTVVALIDTDSDPDLVDLPIPGNDDSIRSIELILSKLAQAVIEGKAAIPPEVLKAMQEPPREERERGRGKGDRRGGGGGRGGDNRGGDRGGNRGRGGNDNRGGNRGGRPAPADHSSDKPEVPAAPAAEPAAPAEGQ